MAQRERQIVNLCIFHSYHDMILREFPSYQVQSFMLTEVRDCELLIVVTSFTFLERNDMLKEKNS